MTNIEGERYGENGETLVLQTWVITDLKEFKENVKVIIS